MLGREQGNTTHVPIDKELNLDRLSLLHFMFISFSMSSIHVIIL